MQLNCVDCTTKVGTMRDKNVPARCEPCREELTQIVRQRNDLSQRRDTLPRITDRRQL